jgi:hypothetical protein
MTRKKQALTIPAFSEPGFFFETLKDGELVASKFSTLELAFASIKEWPCCDWHKASIRYGQYV